MEYIEKDRWIPMEKKEMLYEGKAKKVYTTEDPFPTRMTRPRSTD